MRFPRLSPVVRRALSGLAVVGAAMLLPIEDAAAQSSQGNEPSHVIVDNGSMVASGNPFDLNTKTLLFMPATPSSFAVATVAAEIDPTFGPELTFGFSAATLFPGDDDTQEVAFPAGFPFFGNTYKSVWVNTDGNVTFGEPDFASNDCDTAKHVLGPPRVSAYLIDVNPFNASNPAGSGTIHAASKTGPDRLVVTWNDVADHQGGVSSTFQIVLYSSGAIVLTIDHVDPEATDGVTGIAQGRGQGPFQNVDLSESVPPTVGGAIIEAFSADAHLDTAQTAREFNKPDPDRYEFLVNFTDFPVNGCCFRTRVSNQTHGISAPINGDSREADRAGAFTEPRGFRTASSTAG